MQINATKRKNISERTNDIIETEMQGIRHSIPKAETSNCYGGAERRAAVKALEEHVTFVRVMKKMSQKTQFVLTVCLRTR